MIGLEDNNESITTRKDALPSITQRDEADVRKMGEQLKIFRVFIPTGQEVRTHDNEANIDNEESDRAVHHKRKQLLSLTTNDVATTEIQEDLLSAGQRGQSAVKQIVKTRLVEKSVPFFSPIKRHNSKTFATLYKSA